VEQTWGRLSHHALKFDWRRQAELRPPFPKERLESQSSSGQRTCSNCCAPLPTVEPQAGMSIRKLLYPVGSAWNIEARGLDVGRLLDVRRDLARTWTSELSLGIA
jgi:hypothetical protein